MVLSAGCVHGTDANNPRTRACGLAHVVFGRAQKNSTELGWNKQAFEV